MLICDVFIFLVHYFFPSSSSFYTDDDTPSRLMICTTNIYSSADNIFPLFSPRQTLDFIALLLPQNDDEKKSHEKKINFYSGWLFLLLTRGVRGTSIENKREFTRDVDLLMVERPLCLFFARGYERIACDHRLDSCSKNGLKETQKNHNYRWTSSLQTE